jgi:hypothetical protein
MIYVFHSGRLDKGSRVTVVGVFSNEVLKIAVSRCSKRDNFSRKQGRTIASGRLIKEKYALLLNSKLPPSNSDFIDVALSVANYVDDTFNVYNLNLSSDIKDYIW